MTSPKAPPEIGKFEIPSEVRSYAEASVDQARKAFDQFMTAARHTVTTLDERSAPEKRGGQDVSRQVLTFTDENVAAAFSLALNLVKAATVEEVVKLQSAFLTDRMQALGTQAKAIGEAAQTEITARTASAMEHARKSAEAAQQAVHDAVPKAAAPKGTAPGDATSGD